MTSLLERGFEGLAVLDAFAGSGALGCEALSREAAHVVFVEKDPRALKILRENRSLLGVEKQSTVLLGDTFSPKAVRRLEALGPFDLLILDPPYRFAYSAVRELIIRLFDLDILHDRTLITYEHSASLHDLSGWVESDCKYQGYSATALQMLCCKTYGTTQIDYLGFDKPSHEGSAS